MGSFKIVYDIHSSLAPMSIGWRRWSVWVQEFVFHSCPIEEGSMITKMLGVWTNKYSEYDRLQEFCRSFNVVVTTVIPEDYGADLLVGWLFLKYTLLWVLYYTLLFHPIFL